VGRRHLIRLAAVAATLALAAAATAAPAWRTVGSGAASGPTANAATGYLAFTRASALAQFGTRLPAAGRASLAKVNFAHDAVVAVFGDYGCNDANVVTTAVARHGATVTVKLVPRPPAPGIATCDAIFPTYRLLAVPLISLAHPLPKRVVVNFA
jgi:hypothetical protein